VEKTLDIIVEKADENARLDVFIATRLDITRSLAARAIDEGRVSADGRARKSSFRLKAGMRVQAGIPEEKEPGPLPAASDIPLAVFV
jgi:ribosomal 50S subunit-recycling heat shock protein